MFNFISCFGHIYIVIVHIVIIMILMLFCSMWLSSIVTLVLNSAWDAHYNIERRRFSQYMMCWCFQSSLTVLWRDVATTCNVVTLLFSWFNLQHWIIWSFTNIIRPLNNIYLVYLPYYSRRRHRIYNPPRLMKLSYITFPLHITTLSTAWSV